MAPTYSPRAQAALLKAVNHVFNLSRPADSVDDLVNGVTLAQILHELDPEFDPSEIESNTGASKYLTNKRNIQAVYKGLFRFIRRELPVLASQARKFDYHAVAENPEPQGISQLLAVMVSAAAMGPNNQKYIPRIQNDLDNQTQAEIMNIIRTMQEDAVNAKDDEDLDEAIDAVMEARDIDLLVEEQNAALRQQLDTTKKTLSDYITRLEHLQMSHEELKYEKEKNDRELEVLRKATLDGANSAEAIKALEAQVHEQMEIIARYEETIHDHEKAKSHLESEVQRLSQKSVQADELRDQVTEWKHKAEELEKKANTAERYKQKLESQQGLVKELQNLQYERAELQEQLRSLVTDKERGDRSRTAEAELTAMITQSEQHLWDERNQKNQLIKDFSALEEELTSLKVQRSADETFIKELQEQLQHGGGGGGTGATDAATPSFNLEDELNNAADEDGQPNLPLELSRLKAENGHLRRAMGTTGDAALLRRDLEEQKRQRERLQTNFNELFEKFTIAQDHIEAMTKNMTSEQDQAFINLRAQYVEATEGLEQSKKRGQELETKVADLNRELLDAKAHLSAVDKDRLDAMEDLRSTDKLISESLKAELDRLRDEHNFLLIERDAQKSQLIEVLLAKEQLRKVVDAKEPHDAAAGTGDSDITTASNEKDKEKIAKLRERLKERQQQLEKSEQDRLDAQRKLKMAQGGEAAAAQKAITDQEIKNLKRENALITSAWYDLTSRLQSNHVVLQRRQEVSKSWLGKQRQMVNGQLRRRDSLYLY
jgi:protein HOOK3